MPPEGFNSTTNINPTKIPPQTPNQGHPTSSSTTTPTEIHSANPKFQIIAQQVPDSA